MATSNNGQFSHNMTDDELYDLAASVAKPKTRRYTVDLLEQQHFFLKRFALENGVPASSVIRKLLYLMETDVRVANKVIDEVFAEVEFNDDF